jgi:hypothetical protein
LVFDNGFIFLRCFIQVKIDGFGVLYPVV